MSYSSAPAPSTERLVKFSYVCQLWDRIRKIKDENLAKIKRMGAGIGRRNLKIDTLEYELNRAYECTDKLTEEWAANRIQTSWWRSRYQKLKNKLPLAPSSVPLPVANAVASEDLELKVKQLQLTNNHQKDFLEAGDKKINQQEKLLVQYEKDMEEMENTIGSYRTELEDLKEDVKHFQSIAEDKQSKFNEMRVSRNNWCHKYREAKNELKIYQGMEKAMEKSNAYWDEAYMKKDEECTSLGLKLQIAVRERDDLMTDVSALEYEKENLMNHISALEEERQQMCDNYNSDIQVECSDMEARYEKQLEEGYEARQELEEKVRVLEMEKRLLCKAHEDYFNRTEPRYQSMVKEKNEIIDGYKEALRAVEDENDDLRRTQNDSEAIDRAYKEGYEDGSTNGWSQAWSQRAREIIMGVPMLRGRDTENGLSGRDNEYTLTIREQVNGRSMEENCEENLGGGGGDESEEEEEEDLDSLPFDIMVDGELPNVQDEEDEEEEETDEDEVMNIVNNLPEVPPGLEERMQYQETDGEEDEEEHEDISWYDEVDNEEEDNEGWI